MARGNGPTRTKAELQAEAAAALAAFASQGKTVQQMPTVESKRFVCTFRGHVAVLGARAGQFVRCPRCPSPVS